MSDRDSSFLSRWSRRKAQGRQSVSLPDVATPALPESDATPLAVPAVAGSILLTPRAAPGALETQVPPAQAPMPLPGVAPAAPTLADVAGLSAQSDYSRFMAHGVTPEVKNAALKKLFTDPHFNLMDGLDTYIDDYSTPDPLPAGMLRQMVQSQLLGLFDVEQEGDTAQAAPRAAGATQDTPAIPASATLPGSIEDELRPPPLEAVAAHRSADPSVDKTS